MYCQQLEHERVWAALDKFRIELPSWGFANTGTRFGKFIQPAAATTIADRFADAGQVHRLTGACPIVALHVLWDLPNGNADVPHIQQAADLFVRVALDDDFAPFLTLPAYELVE